MSELPHFNEIIMVGAATRLAEDDTDAAITATIRMIEKVIAAQQGMDAPRHMAQPVLNELSEAIKGHVLARQSITNAHVEIGRIAATFGATPTSYGDLWPCPPMPTEKGAAISPASAAAK